MLYMRKTSNRDETTLRWSYMGNTKIIKISKVLLQGVLEV